MKADTILVNEAKNGQIEAFSELVDRHKRLLLRLAIRVTKDFEMAEDVVQDSFVKAYTKLQSFQGRSSFKSWLYQITLNTARNKLRSIRSNHMSIDKVSLATGSRSESQLLHNDLKIVLKEAVDELPAKQRTALSLRIFDDLSFKEIADIMDCPYDTAKANYRHALMKLRHRFEGESELQQYKEFNTIFPTDLGNCVEMTSK